MCLQSMFPNGYYDDKGQWQRTKFCFIYCGDRCTCAPPGGLYYSEAHDKRKQIPLASAKDLLSTNEPELL